MRCDPGGGYAESGRPRHGRRDHAIALVAAAFEQAVFRGVRRVGARLVQAGALLLILTGGYVVCYSLTAGGLLAA